MRNTNATHKARWPGLLAACWVTALLAGCAGPLGPDTATNRSPVARLAVTPEQAWAGAPVVFDLSASYDPDGRVKHYLLDLGDGTTRELGPQDDLSVEHTYTRGASYAAKLTVTDDGADGGEDAATDQVVASVVVNERLPVDARVVKAGNLTQNVSEEADVPFAVAPEPVAFEVALNATNLLAVGGSSVAIAILDPVGNVIEQHNATLAAGSTVPIAFDGELLQAGGHALRVTATQGGADIDGELVVLYG